MRKTGNVILTAAFALTTITATAGAYDYLVDSITSDGIGVIDTGYRYRRSAAPQTKRLEVRFYNNHNGKTPDSTSKNFALLGFYGDSNTRQFYIRCDDGTWKVISATSQSSSSGSWGTVTLSLDFFGQISWTSSINGTHPLSGSATPTPSGDAKQTLYLAGINSVYTTPAPWCPGYFQYHYCRIYETNDGGATETLAHEYLPCCAEGRAAMYDRVTGDILFPTTDGFTIPAIDITVAAGKSMKIGPANMNPLSITLAADSGLVFDGTHVLDPVAAVGLPAAGKIRIGISAARDGQTLIRNLPANWELDRFELVDVPADAANYNDFALIADEDRLKLSVTAKPALPQALADGTGFIDTGYRYRCSAAPKTKRINLRYYNNRNGKADGITGNACGLIGYYGKKSNGDCSYLRFNNSGWQLGNTGAAVSSSDGNFGNCETDIDYFGNVFWTNSIYGVYALSGTAIAAPTTDANVTYSFFDVRNEWLDEGTTWCPGAFKLYRCRIYETLDDGVSEYLAHDFVPCSTNGVAAIFDFVTGETRLPTGNQSPFTLSDLRWRLTEDGVASFCTNLTPIVCSAADADGYLVTSDLSGEILTRCTDAATPYPMPEQPVSLQSTRDLAIDDDGGILIENTTFVNHLTIGENVLIGFNDGGMLILSGSVTLPTDGSVDLRKDDLSRSGDFTLMRGLERALDLTRLNFINPDESRFACTLSQVGDELRLQVEKLRQGSVYFVW